MREIKTLEGMIELLKRDKEYKEAIKYATNVYITKQLIIIRFHEINN